MRELAVLLLIASGYAQNRQERPAAGGLEAAFRETAHAQTAWIAYAVPASGASGWNCQSSQGVRPPGPVHLEPPDQMFVLFRVEQGQVTRIRTLPADCLLDSDGLPLFWLTDVRPAESVSFLETFLQRGDRLAAPAMAAIAQHSDPAAARELIRIARGTGEPRLRKQAFFWLARSRDPQAWAFIEKILQ